MKWPKFAIRIREEKMAAQMLRICRALGRSKSGNGTLQELDDAIITGERLTRQVPGIEEIRKRLREEWR
jgi:hypothetical protein